MRPGKSLRRKKLRRRRPRQKLARELIFESLEDRRLLTVAWRNPVDALDVDADGAILVQDAIHVLTDLSNNGARKLPPQRSPSSAYFDPTGDQRSSVQDLFQVLQHLSSKGAGRRILGESATQLHGESLVTISIGASQGTRHYRVQIDATFDTSDAQSNLGDQFSVYVVDHRVPANTLLDRREPGTSVFTLSEARVEYAAGIARWDGHILDLDLSGLVAGDTAMLKFQLLNQDQDTGGRVVISPLANDWDPEGAKPPALPPQGAPVLPGADDNLVDLVEVPKVFVQLSNVRYVSSPGRYIADLQLHNAGADLGRAMAVAFKDLPAGVSLREATGITPDGFPFLDLRPAIASSGLRSGASSTRMRVEFDNPNHVRFPVRPVVLARDNRPPQLSPLGPFETTPGATLSIPLVASDPDQDRVTLSIEADGPLPSGELRPNGWLVFRPAVDELGTYQFDVVATDGALTTRQPVTVHVRPDADRSTRISGQLKNTHDQPLDGIPVELAGVSTVTSSDGKFVITLPAPLNPGAMLKVFGNQRAAQDAQYPLVAEPLELVLGRAAWSEVNNVIDRPIYLQALERGETIDPARAMEVPAASLPGASLTVAAHTLKDSMGDWYRGELSITEVRPDRTPIALPEGLSPDLVVTIQPAELAFSKPAAITLPNRSGWAAGAELDLWSVEPGSKQLAKMGKGQVSQDGKSIQTKNGGVHAGSWVFFAGTRPTIRGVSGAYLILPIDVSPPVIWRPDLSDAAVSVYNDALVEAPLNTACFVCPAAELGEANSYVEAHSGAVQEDHQLATYQSLGEQRGVRLHYDSFRADPRPILHFSPKTIPEQHPNLRLMAKFSLGKGTNRVYAPGHPGGELGLSGGENFWTVPVYDFDQPLVPALQVDGSRLPSGLHPYELSLGFYQFQGNTLQGSSTITTGRLIHVNSIGSPFGSGWGLADWQELVVSDDGHVLLIDGDGSQRLFRPDPSDSSRYVSPPGDFTRLERLSDGSFLRTFTDGTRSQFDERRQLATVTDRNGNTTRYLYDARQRLEKLIDPVGLETRFEYGSHGRVSLITDPAGRRTELTYDHSGNLTRIVDPDGAVRRWEYDERHRIVAEIDALGRRGTDSYHPSGRLESAVLKDGTEVRFFPLQVHGLLPSAMTSDPRRAALAPLAQPPVAAHLDGAGNLTTIQVDPAGQSLAKRDGVGPVDTLARNSRNLLELNKNARGQPMRYEYDQRGNLVRSIQPVSIAEEGPASDSMFAGTRFSVDTRFATAVGDVNEDGKLDMVSTSFNTASVLLGDGRGGLSKATTVTVGQSPYSIALADVNHDQHLDMIVGKTRYSNYYGDVSVFFGDGQGNFQHSETIFTGCCPTDIEVADLNRDGHPDLAIARGDAEHVTLLYGNGTGQFAAPLHIPVPGTQSISIADLNGDEHLDIVTAGDFARYDGRGFVSVLLADGSGGFAAAVPYDVAEGATAVELDDVDGDGVVDIVTANSGSVAISVLTGNGNGTYQPAKNFRGAHYGSLETTDFASLAMVDLTGDGRRDLALLNSRTAQLAVLIADGRGGFHVSNTYAVSRLEVQSLGNFLVAGDFNGDGRIDLAVDDGHAMTILKGDGQGGFAAPLSTATGVGFEVVLVVDVNGDEIPDLVTGDESAGHVDMHLGSGEGAFAWQSRFRVGGPVDRIVSADLNGDRNADLIVASARAGVVSLLYGDGTGDFVSPDDLAIDGAPLAVAVGDVSGDGQPDLVTADGSGGTVTILSGGLAGPFATRTTFALGADMVDVVLADANGDQRLDIIAVDRQRSRASVLLAEAAFRFSNPLTFDTPTSPTSVDAADWNEDGAVDLFFAHQDGQFISYAFGNGQGEFSLGSTYGANGPIQHLFLRDVDDDGHLDLLAVTRSFDSSELLLGFGDGLGGFQTFRHYNLPNQQRSQGADLADVNQDGWLDLVVSSDDYKLARSLTVGLGAADLQFNFTTESWPGSGAESFAVGDFDRDGYQDVVTANLGSRDLVLFHGDGTGSLRRGAVVRLAGLPDVVRAADVDGDGWLDLIAHSRPRITQNSAEQEHLSVVRGKGDGTFGPATVLLSGESIYQFELADLNHDGYPDIVATNKVLLNDRTGQFTSSQEFADREITSFRLGDLNRDGFLDLVIWLDRPFTFYSSVRLGDGNGRFGPVLFKDSRIHQTHALGDVNGDGWLDAIHVFNRNYLSISFGTNGGSLLPPVRREVPLPASSVALTDVNGDTFLDLVGSTGSAGFVVSLGDGAGDFGQPREFLASSYTGAVGVADLNRDRIPDVIGLGQYSNQITVSLGGQSEILQHVVELSYDPAFGRPTRITDERGNPTNLEIDPANGNVRSLTQANGATTRYTYTPQGLTDTQTDALGRITDYDYDAWGRLVTLTEAVGTAVEARRRFEYDAAGNRTAAIDEIGRKSHFTYDALNRLTKVRDALGNETHYTYDTLGNQVAVEDPRGNRTTSVYDGRNRLVSTKNARGEIIRFDYDRNGNLTASRDPAGRTTRYRYDARNRLIETIDAAGGRTRLEYDADNNLIASLDPLGRRTRYVYDARNRRVRQTDAFGNNTQFAYDEADNVVAITDRNGHRTQFTYDALNRLESQSDALGGITRYQYDALDRLVSTTDPLGRVTTQAYDDRDRLIQLIDPLQQITTFGYDPAGNLVQQTDPLGRTTLFAYDALDRRVGATDPLGNATQFRYDAAGNLVEVVDPLGRATQFAYDVLNREVSRTDALAGTTSLIYDAVGNTTSVSDPLGRTTSFQYDSLDRLIRTTDPLGHITRTAYDLNGNELSRTDGLGKVTRYTYDALDRLTSSTDPRGGVTRYAYDDEGNLTRLTDAVGNVTQFAHDALNRKVTELNSWGTRQYQYDAVGNLTSATDRNGRVRQSTYDALNRRTAERWLDAQNQELRRLTFTYDAAGQLTATSDPAASYGYAYDAAGRLISATNAGTPGVPVVALAYAYDAAGNVLTRADTIGDVAGGQNAYQYDALNRMTRVTQSGTGVASKRVDLAYNAAGQLTSVLRRADLAGNHLVAASNYTYDQAGRLTTLRHTQHAAVLAAYSWDYDQADRITRMTSSDGSTTLAYDATDQLLAADHSFQADEALSYDLNGNRTSGGNQVGPQNRLVSDGQFQYAYDTEGNRTRRTSIATGAVTEYEWDHRNRLVRVTDKSAGGIITGESRYGYDSLDRRLSKNVDVDGAGPLPATDERYVYDGPHQVLALNGQGTVTHRYLHGPAIDQVLADEQATDVYWALTDHLGSVRDLVDSTGSVVNHLTYDSFGRVTSESNPGLSHLFAFTGRERDKETGLHYYRARYYDAAVGRFLSEDPIGFDGGDANLYRYTFNNPLSYRDPTGNTPSEFATAVEAQASRMGRWIGETAGTVGGLAGSTLIRGWYWATGNEEGAARFERWSDDGGVDTFSRQVTAPAGSVAGHLTASVVTEPLHLGAGTRMAKEELDRGNYATSFAAFALDVLRALPIAGAAASGGRSLIGAVTGKAPNLFTSQGNIDAILGSRRIWGLTEGNVYAGLTARTAKSVKTALLNGRLPTGSDTAFMFTGQAARVFRAHEIWGPFSAWKALGGQFKGGFGDIRLLSYFRDPAGTIIVTKAMLLEARHVAPWIGWNMFGPKPRLWSRRLFDLATSWGLMSARRDLYDCFEGK